VSRVAPSAVARWLAAGTVMALATTAGGAVKAQAPAGSAPAAAEPASAPATPSFLELADRLRAIGSHTECAVEALRHAHQRPQDRQRGFDRAALCLSLAGRFEDARRLMLSLAKLGPLDRPARLRLCLTEVFLPALEDASGCEPLAQNDGFAAHTRVMRALHAGRWPQARALLDRQPVPEPAPSTEATNPAPPGWIERDRAFLRRQETLPRRSPWLAGTLSAVVPGLGRVYLGRWQDGILSFFLVGVTAGISAHGFYQDGRSSVRGWLFGSTAAVFYLGNVYGSAVGALVQHREREEELLREVQRDYRGRMDALP
jgi:hypothetical protein